MGRSDAGGRWAAGRRRHSSGGSVSRMAGLNRAAIALEGFNVGPTFKLDQAQPDRCARRCRLGRAVGDNHRWPYCKIVPVHDAGDV